MFVPIELFIYDAVINNHYSSDTFITFISMGLFFSVPALAICYLIFIISCHRSNSVILIQTIFCIVCIVCVFITFIIISGEIEATFSILYSVNVILAIAACKVFKKQLIISTSIILLHRKRNVQECDAT